MYFFILVVFQCCKSTEIDDIICTIDQDFLTTCLDVLACLT